MFVFISPRIVPVTACFTIVKFGELHAPVVAWRSGWTEVQHIQCSYARLICYVLGHEWHIFNNRGLFVVLSSSCLAFIVSHWKTIYCHRLDLSRTSGINLFVFNLCYSSEITTNIHCDISWSIFVRRTCMVLTRLIVKYASASPVTLCSYPVDTVVFVIVVLRGCNGVRHVVHKSNRIWHLSVLSRDWDYYNNV